MGLHRGDHRHPAAVGVGVRRDPPPRPRLLAGRAVPGAAGRRRALPRRRGALARPGAPEPPRPARDRGDRRAVVRRLQRGAQRGRAPGGRRHRLDAAPGLAGADRGAGGDLPRASGSPASSAGGLLLAFAGVGRDRRSAPRPAATATPSGVVLCLVAALVYSISLILQKPIVGRLPAVQVTWLACTVGAVVCLPFAGPLVHETRAAPVSSVLWVVYLGRLPDGHRVHDLRLRAAPHARRAGSA